MVVLFILLLANMTTALCGQMAGEGVCLIDQGNQENRKLDRWADSEIFLWGGGGGGSTQCSQDPPRRGGYFLQGLFFFFQAFLVEDFLHFFFFFGGLGWRIILLGVL